MDEGDSLAQRQELLRAAQYFAKLYNAESDKKKFHHKLALQYDIRIPVAKTLLKLAQRPDDILTAKDATKYFVRVFAHHGIHDDFSYHDAYQNILRMMHGSEPKQKVLQDYKGHYTSFRRGRQNFIRGSVLIGRKGLVPWFWHSSEQSIEGVRRRFQHEGFAILADDRLYLIAIGRDYLRQMTLRAVLRPAEEPMPGIVLTERAAPDPDTRWTPLASKIVVFRDALNPSDSDVEVHLKNESPVEGVIYGWPV